MLALQWPHDHYNFVEYCLRPLCLAILHIFIAGEGTRQPAHLMELRQKLVVSAVAGATSETSGGSVVAGDTTEPSCASTVADATSEICVGCMVAGATTETSGDSAVAGALV